MNQTIVALALLALPAFACAEVPPGPDAINGSFARLLAPAEARSLPAERRSSSADTRIEDWVNATLRGDFRGCDEREWLLAQQVSAAPAPRG